MDSISLDRDNGSILWIVWFPLQVLLYTAAIYTIINPGLGSDFRFILAGLISVVFSFFKTGIETGDIQVDWAGPTPWGKGGNMHEVDVSGE